MSLRTNVLANYASQIYVTLVGIAVTPIYIRTMGPEAYGLVGFFALLQAWFQLLDMGLTPTMARETARFRGGATDANSLRQLLRSLEGIFIGVAVVGILAMAGGAGIIAVDWLKVQKLPLQEVRHVIQIMAIIVGLRWLSELYRGTITGFERLVWLSNFKVLVTTARFILVVPFLWFVSRRPDSFFAYQLAVAALELAVLMVQAYRLLPRSDGHRVPWCWEPLRKVLKFSLSVAFTGSVWVLITQTDKVVLSKLLPLSEYAYFSLAVLVAGGITIISVPISGPLLPRLTTLAAEGNDGELVRVYRNATQVLGVLAIPCALMLAFFPAQLLWLWTGDPAVAAKAATILALYGLGNGFLVFAAFPYYLQFAKGDLKLHLIGNGIFVAVLLPSLIWATLRFGTTGAGYAWLCSNILSFLLWVPLVHRRFFKHLHSRWLAQDVLAIIIPSVLAALVLKTVMVWSHSRPILLVQLLAAGAGVLIPGLLGSSWARGHLKMAYRGFLHKGGLHGLQ